MVVKPENGLITVACSDLEFICLCRPNSMLEELTKINQVEASWNWCFLPDSDDSLLILKPFQANFLIREGKARIAQEKQLLGEIYEFLLEHKLLDASKSLYD